MPSPAAPPSPPSPGAVYGVLGHPLGQSLSPALHAWALARAGFPATYTAWDVAPKHLDAFMRDFRAEPNSGLNSGPYAGASVTIPHKLAVMPYLDGVTDTARAVGAVNTLYWDDGRLLGHNTDLEGFLSPLAGELLPGAALVLGAGGAARAVLAGLAHLGVPRVYIAARARDRADALAASFTSSLASVTGISWDERARIPHPGAGLWAINTTPLGMRGKAEGESPLSLADFSAIAAPEHSLAYDLVYNPLQTAFLKNAAASGWACRDGLDMFAAQAAAQFHLWTGGHMPRDEAKAFLAERLAL